MLPGNYTIIGESKELGKCEGGNLTKNEVVRVTRSLKKRWRNWALMGDVGQRIKVTVRSAGSETEKEKQFVVEKVGEVEEDEGRNVFLLQKKAIQFGDGNGEKMMRLQTFVNNGSFNCEVNVPARAGQAEESVKFCMFINQERKLVMLCEGKQKGGFVWSSKTTAQRD